MESWQIENVCTLLICVLGMVGLYAFGAGGHSFWALILLLNINNPGGAEAKDGD